jgi:hypothetical protein
MEKGQEIWCAEREEPVEGRVTDLTTRDKVTGIGEDYMTGSFLICTPLYQI